MKEIVDLLRTGVSQRGAVFGPMAAVVQHSLQETSLTDLNAMATYLKAAAQQGAPAEPAQVRPTGAQTEAFVADAVESCRKDTVVKALAVLAKTDDATVRRVLDSKSAKSAIALVWRAGLSMRVAFQLQVQVMRLAGNVVIPARRGIDFPLTDEEMRWHLDYFDIK